MHVSFVKLIAFASKQFKEQLEPDRIAFALKEQLYKAMKNQTQAKGSSLQGAFASAPFAGGR